MWRSWFLLLSNRGRFLTGALVPPMEGRNVARVPGMGGADLARHRSRSCQRSTTDGRPQNQ